MICQVMSTDCEIVYNRDMTETRLERALRAAPRPTPVDALALDRLRWLAGERLDMGALAK